MLIAVFADRLPAQESATPEVQAATPTPKKPPTLKELAQMVELLQRENLTLKSNIPALQTRLDVIERAPAVSDLDRRVRALEQSAVTDIYRELGIPRGQSLDVWHREMHKRDSSLRLRSERELEDWHRNDHQRRRDLLDKW